MIHYPLRFAFQSQSSSGIQKGWTSSPLGGRALDCAIPPEFEGPGGGFSPEDYFGLAVINCFIATFKVIAEKSKLGFQGIQAQGELVVDRDEKGAPWMSQMKIEIHLTLIQAQDGPRAQHLLEKTAASCLVARSIKTDVQFQFQIQ